MSEKHRIELGIDPELYKLQVKWAKFVLGVWFAAFALFVGLIVWLG